MNKTTIFLIKIICCTTYLTSENNQLFLMTSFKSQNLFLKKKKIEAYDLEESDRLFRQARWLTADLLACFSTVWFHTNDKNNEMKVSLCVYCYSTFDIWLVIVALSHWIRIETFEYKKNALRLKRVRLRPTDVRCTGWYKKIIRPKRFLVEWG